MTTVFVSPCWWPVPWLWFVLFLVSWLYRHKSFLTKKTHKHTYTTRDFVLEVGTYQLFYSQAQQKLRYVWFDLAQPYNFFSANVVQPRSVLFSSAIAVSINWRLSSRDDILWCIMLKWMSAQRSVFQQQKANAGLFRKRFIFGHQLCQRCYLEALSARLMGYILRMFPASWDLSGSQKRSSQYLDRWPQRKLQWFSRCGPSSWVTVKMRYQTVLCCWRTHFLLEILKPTWALAAILYLMIWYRRTIMNDNPFRINLVGLAYIASVIQCQ